MAEMICRLLDRLTVDAIYDLPPATRRRFADVCRHWADVAAKADLAVTGYKPIQAPMPWTANDR
jgi:hypothetical protein